MIRPFHTLPDIMELGLLVARIQNESGADHAIDVAVMDLFFTRNRSGIGWDNPLTGEWIGNADYQFTLKIDGTVRAIRKFLPESSWTLHAPSEQPSTALVRYDLSSKASTALTPERALLTAFLCLADQLQRAAT